MKILTALSLMLLCTLANASDIRDTSCRTTQECQAEADKIRGNITTDATSALAKRQTQFYWMNRINMASTVMLVEEKIILEKLVKTIAEGVQYAITQGALPDGKRPDDVLQLEKIISEKAGPEATLIHTGRSRQDMYATIRMKQLRRQVLDMAEALLNTQSLLIEIAAKHTESFIPAYTNGVQAQPVSYAHYLMGYADSLGRDAERLKSLYPRLNLSAMGTSVLANSSWALNRPRMAELLGFDGLVENSFDAGQIISIDVPLEAAAIASSAAIRIGALLQDIHTQYHQTRPWLLLADGSTYTSSAMPQKRNPGVIMAARMKASDVVASSQQMLFRAHNVTSGMTDAKTSYDDSHVFLNAVLMFKRFDGVMKALVMNKARAMEELEADWTTSVELAETLQRLHNIPFRVGHHFASEIVTYAKDKNILPKDFPYSEAKRIYTEASQKYNQEVKLLPLNEAGFRATLSPENMVRTRVGIGGPQPIEVARMIKNAKEVLAKNQAWLLERNSKLLEAEAKLNNAFSKLL
jgi:argininosuccinate lyase